MYLIPRHLWQKLMIVLVLVVAVPVILLGNLLIKTSQQALKTSMLEAHEEIAVRAAEEVQLFISCPQKILLATGAMIEVAYPDLWKQETILVEVALNFPSFIRIVATDETGREIISSRPGLPLSDRAQGGAFKIAVSGERYISHVTIDPTRSPYLTLAIPIKRLGRVMGTLIAEVDVRGLWNIVDNIHIGKTGNAYVVSEEGIVIAHPDKKLVMSNYDFTSHMIIKDVLSGKTGSVEPYEEDNVLWISAYAPIPELGWGLITRQAAGEAFSFSRLMLYQSWLILGLGVTVSVVISFLLARILVRPIKALVVSAKRAALGDMDTHIFSQRKDELGDLVSSFNHMLEKLKKAKAAERLSVIGATASGIAHELKNPLVSLKTFIQLFPRKYADQKYRERFQRIIPQELSRLEDMLNELSDFSRESGLIAGKVNLHGLLGDVLELMSVQLQEGEIVVERKEYSEAKIIVPGDSDKLRQVFMNIIINAIHAMKEGGRLSIATRLEPLSRTMGRNNQRVVITISDTGCGIPGEEAEKIFQPFYSYQKKGMGLGLAITKGIVEQHAGTIQVKSQVNMGTMFTITLPIT